MIVQWSCMGGNRLEKDFIMVHNALKELITNISGIVPGIESELTRRRRIRFSNSNGNLVDIDGSLSIPESVVRKSIAISGIPVSSAVRHLSLDSILLTELLLPSSMYSFSYNSTVHGTDIGLSFFGQLPDVFSLEGRYIDIKPKRYEYLLNTGRIYDMYVSDVLGIDYDRYVQGKGIGYFYEIRMLNIKGSGECLCIIKNLFMRSPDKIPPTNYIKYGEYPRMGKFLENVVDCISDLDPVECVYILPGRKGCSVFEDINGSRYVIVYGG